MDCLLFKALQIFAAPLSTIREDVSGTKHSVHPVCTGSISLGILLLKPLAVRDYDCRIIKYAEQLNLLIAACVDEPINVYAKFSFFTSDVMSDLSFGKSFGQLIEDKFHPSVLGVREFMGVFGTMSPIPW